MAKRMVSGKLLGIVDGPFILIEVRSERQRFPLDCEVTVEWVSAHIDRPIICMVTDDRVTEVK